jgi:hypothetical protein
MSRLMEAATANRPVEVIELINYTMDQLPFVHTVSLRPISNSEGLVETLRVESSGARMIGSGQSAHRAPGEKSRDTQAVSRRRRASGDPSPPAVPDGDIVVITHGYAPYIVVWASPAWLKLCGFNLNEMTGASLRCIQGPGTDRIEVRRMMDHVRDGRPVTVERLINYDKHNVPYSHMLSIVPFSSPTGGVFFRASSTSVNRLGPPPRSLCQPSRSDTSWADELESYLKICEEPEHSWDNDLARLMLRDGSSSADLLLSS